MGGHCLSPGDPDYVWPYCPSFAAAIVGFGLFSFTTLILTLQTFRYRRPFCWVLIMAGLWEAGGFLVRAYATHHQDKRNVYALQQLLIILAPIWVNGFVYMAFGRLVQFFLPAQKIFGIKATKMSLIFVLLDILSFLVQGASAALMTTKNSNNVELGLHIYMAGVGLQQAFICLFFVLAITFHVEMSKIGNTRATSWRMVLWALYAALVLITVRIIFRLIEYSSGHVHGVIPSHEIYFYVLDAVPMFIAISIFDFVHPGKVLTLRPRSGGRGRDRLKDVEYAPPSGEDIQMNTTYAPYPPPPPTYHQ